MLTKSKLYAILLIACTAGYIWLWLNLANDNGNVVGGCLIKHATNIPCPSCGTTRAILLLLQGRFLDSLYINPFGLMVLMIMFFVPLWIAFDELTKKETLYRFYYKTESVLQRPEYAVPGIVLVVVNWGWNIIKGL